MWRQLRNPMIALMYTAPEGDGTGGGGGGAAPPAPAPAPPQPAGGTPPAGGGTPPPSGTPGAGGAPTPPAKSFSFAEDRSNWIPPHRGSEMAERARQAEANALRYAAMLKAGTGVDLPMHLRSPEDQQSAAAREELYAIFPQLKLLEKLEKMFPQLEETITQLPDVIASRDQYWTAQGHRTLSSLHDGAAEMYGMKAADLTPFQKNTINQSFMSWLQGNPEAGERFGRGDSGVVNEYFTEWRNGFFEPARRVAQGGGGGGTPPPAPGANRGRNDLPPAPRGSGIPPSGGAPPKPKTEDEVHDGAWAGFKAALEAGRR